MAADLHDNWERQRAREVMTYVGNKLIGVHLNPVEAQILYQAIVRSTWPDPDLKWPPEARQVAIMQLETERRIKE